MAIANYKYKEEYYTHPESYIQDLIARAKTNETVAQQEILAIFGNFLTKYVTMLYNDRYNVGDYDIRRFVSLYIPDPFVRQYLRRNNLNDGGRKLVVETMRGINYMVRRYGDEEDVWQTVRMTFLDCVERYTPKQSKINEAEIVPFKGFLYNYYFYLLKKNVDLMLIDQSGRKSYPLITEEELAGGEDSEEKPVGFAPPEQELSAEEMFGSDTIDEFWVVGTTAKFPFNKLTPQERQLLKWRYVDGLRASEISKKILEHQNTCRENLSRIKLKLVELVDAEEDFW